MPKEKVLPWFLQKILIPGNEIADRPGYIVTKVSDAKTTIYLREICFFEDILVDLEKAISKKYGKKGRLALYKAGKEFGYVYSELSSFERYSAGNQKEFEQFFKLFMDYIRALWFSDYTYKIDCEKKIFTAEFQKHLVCSKNGLGSVLTEGCYAGFWAYLMGDLGIEGKQTKCQGRGDKKCAVIFGPNKLVGADNVPIDAGQLMISREYNAINAIRPTKHTRSSFIGMLKNKLFKYDNGVALYNKNRIFFIGSNFIYHLERELEKIDPKNSVLFDVCFNVGKRSAAPNDEMLIPEIFSLCGWGEPIIIKDEKGKRVVLNEIYPWFKTKFEHKFVIYRGLLSGMISRCFGKDIKLKTYSSLISDSYIVTVRE